MVEEWWEPAIRIYISNIVVQEVLGDLSLGYDFQR